MHAVRPPLTGALGRPGRWRLGLLTVAALLALAACTGGTDDATSGAESAVADRAVEAAAESGPAEDVAAAEAQGSAEAQVPVTAQQVATPGDVRDRQVIKTATATVIVDDGTVEDAVTQVLRIADRYDAVVTSSSTTGTAGDVPGGRAEAADVAGPQPPYGVPVPQPRPGGGVRATLTLGVPSGDLDAVLAALDDVGDIAARQVASEEVTAEFIDLEARRDNLADQAAFYRDLLDASDDVDESIKVREQLDAVVTELEQVEGRLRYLRSRVELSQLTVSLVEAAAASTAPTGVGEQLSDAVGRGASVAVGVLTSMIVAVGALAPIAAVAAMIAAVVWAGVVLTRRLRSRRRAAATTD